MTTALAEAPIAGIDHPFVQALVRILRAEDSYGHWEKLSDAVVLKDFIVTKEPVSYTHLDVYKRQRLSRPKVGLRP